MSEHETTEGSAEATDTMEAPAEEAREDAPPEAAQPAVSHVGESEAAHHPDPSAYVGIAVILAVVTAAEVGLYYVTDVDAWLISTALVVLMAIKFFLVAMWFMHLRFETPLFRRLFYGGAVLAVVAYGVVLGASGVFPFFV